MTSIDESGRGTSRRPTVRPYAANALLFAAMAYPRYDEGKRRAAAAAALRSRYVRALHVRLGDEANEHVDLEDALRPPSEVNAGLRHLEGTLRRRLLAGHMACAFLKAAEQKQPPRELPKVGALTVANVTAHYGEMAGLDDRRARRTFSEAYSILPLCSAVAVGFHLGLRAKDGPKTIFDHMQDDCFGLRVLNEARRHLELMKRSPALDDALAQVQRF